MHRNGVQSVCWDIILLFVNLTWKLQSNMEFSKFIRISVHLNLPRLIMPTQCQSTCFWENVSEEHKICLFKLFVKSFEILSQKSIVSILDLVRLRQTVQCWSDPRARNKCHRNGKPDFDVINSTFQFVCRPIYYFIEVSFLMQMTLIFIAQNLRA